jgi:hypothetical protein
MTTEIVVKVPEKIQVFAESIVDRAQVFVVDSGQKMAEAADILARIKLAEKEAEKERKFLVQPLNDHVGTINDRFKTITGPLKEARAIIDGKVLAYNRALEEAAAKEQARLRREETLRQKKLDEEKAALEAKGIKLNIAPQEPAAPIVVAPPAKTTAGSYSKMTITKTPAFRLVDIEKVPAKYLLVNEVATNQAARDGVKTIAGMEWYEKEVIRNR